MKRDMKFLVVDDFATMRKIIVNLLRDFGITDVWEADDGSSALPMLQNTDFDFVITDYDMPNVSGIDLLKSIRSDKKNKDIPVLIVTADAKRERIFEAVEAGVNGYIVKPFTGDILKTKIDKVLSRIYQ